MCVCLRPSIEIIYDVSMCNKDYSLSLRHFNILLLHMKNMCMLVIRDSALCLQYNKRSMCVCLRPSIEFIYDVSMCKKDYSLSLRHSNIFFLQGQARVLLRVSRHTSTLRSTGLQVLRGLTKMWVCTGCNTLYLKCIDIYHLSERIIFIIHRKQCLPS